MTNASQHAASDTAPREQRLVLVANAGEGTISVFRFEDGRLERVFVAEDLQGCSNFVVDTDRDLVYAAVKGDPAGIVTLALDRDRGSLTPIARRDTPRGGLNYVALVRGGSALLGAAYGASYGLIAPIEDGVVGADAATVSYTHLHSVLPSPDGRHAYFVSLGDDLIAQYAIGDDLSLTPLDPATVAAPAGSGPRHLLLDASGETVYVLTEFSGEVLAYRRDTERGALSLIGAATAFDTAAGLAPSALGLSPLEHRVIWGADLRWGADQRVLWASERSESTLAAVALGADGVPVAATDFTVSEPQPRGLDVSADGAYAVVAGERSTTVSLYRLTGARPELLQRAETGRGANWVRFV